MKAVRVSALSSDLSGVALDDIAEPTRSPGQLLVRMRAASLNYPDLLMTRGEYQLKPPLPFVPGMEAAGEVIEADPTSGFASGDRVVCGTRLDAFAEILACDASAARAIPARLDYAQAASIGVAYLTAYVGLVRLGALATDDWVLVHGATGGVGLAAVDLAQSLGARVIATSRSPEKLQIVADAYSPAATLPAPGFRAAVRDLTGGGADIVVDPVGGDVFDESTRCTAFGGRLLVVGFASGRIATLPTNIALIKGFSMIGVRAGEYARRFPRLGAENLDSVWAMAGEGRLRPRVHAIYRLAEWRDAFAAMAAATHVGKIVLVP
ncbi:NADPH:quinone oxidoreductase [Sphingomonas sp. Leaf34]|uniref:NADPH:quinone oxidoreductase family protein n=1 Tax=Sphingomonas sp. Leaf34 TaxID=1736216 RepID=UPI0006FBDA25|nr:NADPH:quinone oxidoreductase family protein [Sphingomonas sp. Leaf34]KQN27075.1 NADPH:quinone oxidoreductase [Sphingomonas sp. Leaf34]